MSFFPNRDYNTRDTNWEKAQKTIDQSKVKVRRGKKGMQNSCFELGEEEEG